MPVQSRWDNFIETFFRADLIEEYYYSIWEGVQVTCIIAVLVVFTGIILGLVLAVFRSYRIKPINFIFRGDFTFTVISKSRASIYQGVLVSKPKNPIFIQLINPGRRAPI